MKFLAPAEQLCVRIPLIKLWCITFFQYFLTLHHNTILTINKMEVWFHWNENKIPGLFLNIFFFKINFQNDRKIILGGKEVSLAQQYGVVALCSIPMFLLAGAGSVVFWVIGKCPKNIEQVHFLKILVVLLHYYVRFSQFYWHFCKSIIFSILYPKGSLNFL